MLPLQRMENCRKSSMGLRILIQDTFISTTSHHHHQSGNNNNILLMKPTMILIKRPSTSSSDVSVDDDDDNLCFLKACFLCKKKLSSQMDIYMYRGDQGFCSVACRERQMFLDEKEEMEAATKETLVAYRSSHCKSNKATWVPSNSWGRKWATTAS